MALRSVQILIRVLAVALFVLIVLLMIGASVSQTGWFQDWIGQLVVRQAAQYVNGTLSIGRLRGSLFTNVALDEVVLHYGGKPVVSVDKVVVNYDLRTIFREGLVLEVLALTKPVIRLERGPDGWNFMRFVKTRKSAGRRRPIALRDVQIADGHVEVHGSTSKPYVFDDLDTRFRFSTTPDEIALTVSRLSSRVEPIAMTMRELSGAAYLHQDDLDVRDVNIVTDRSRVTGRMTLRDYRTKAVLDAAIEGDPLSVPELSRFLPWLSDVTLEPRIHAEAKGNLDELGATVDIVSRTAGRARGPLVMDLREPGRSIRGTLDTEHINLARIFRNIGDPTDISGQTRFDVTLPSARASALAVSFQFGGPEVRAFGYRATNLQVNGFYTDRIVRAEGQGTAYGAFTRVRSVFRFPPPHLGRFSYTTSGTFSNLNLINVPRTLPTPPLDSRLAGSFDLEGHGNGWSGSARLNESVVEGATFAPGTTGRIAVQSSSMEYQASGHVTDLDVQRWGRPLNLPVLLEDRYRSRLNGDFTMSGGGRALDQLRLDVDAKLMDSAALGGRLPQLNVNLQLADRRLMAALQGSFENIDLSPLVPQIPEDTALTGSTDATVVLAQVGGPLTADQLRLDVDATLMNSAALGGRLPQLKVNLQLADRRLMAALQGSFENIDLSPLVPQIPEDTALTGSTDATVVLAQVGAPLTPDTIEATGRLSLTKSTIGAVAIDSADVTGAYADRLGRIDRLTVNGPDFAATASGILALDDHTESNLQYDIDATDLALVAKLTERPVSGAAQVSGTVTGPSALLTSMGTLSANRLKYGDNVDLLTLNSRFTATVPDLDPKRIAGRADSTASFAKIGGLEVTELTADTTYNAPELEFRTSFAQQTRVVSAAGLAVLHPDQQELRLRSVSLGIGQTTWGLPPGREARIHYGPRAITLSGLDLERGEQHLTAGGTLYLGSEGSAPIEASDLEIRAERLQIKDLNDLMLGQRQVAGILDGMAHLTGTLADPEIAGTFSLTNGQVQGVSFEALTGKVDYRARAVALDVQLRQSAAASLKATGAVPLSLFRAPAGALPDEPIDLRVESTAIELGLFQALTTQLQNLRGQLQVNMHATGTARTPHVEGDFNIVGASFSVAATGAMYHGLDTQLHFAGDQLVVEQFRVLDDDNDALNAEGALGIQARRIGTVDVLASASQFKVLENEFGNVELDALLRVTGEAQSPTIEGNIETRAGRLQVDRLIEQFTKSPYPTEALQSSNTESTPSLFDASSLALKVRVLDNLLLRGSGIRAPSSRLGLGDVNVTVGGELDLQKNPNDSPRLVGNVDVVRGFYNFQGRRFDVLRDSLIRFEGLDITDPTLRITAERQISGVIAQVQLNGTVKMPELTLSSQPPLDEADILSLIVFNAPVNELGQNERISLAQRAGELAAGYVTTPLANSIAEALNLDVVEISTAGDIGGGPAVSIGQQVGNRLFVSFKQEFGAEDNSQLSFEYRLTELLRLVTTIAQGAQRTHRMQRIESSSADLILAISY